MSERGQGEYMMLIKNYFGNSLVWRMFITDALSTTRLLVWILLENKQEKPCTGIHNEYCFDTVFTFISGKLGIWQAQKKL